MMDEKKKKKMLDDESLDQVVGGGTMHVNSPGTGSVICRSGPGYNYNSTGSSFPNGCTVYTVDKVYNEEDGIYWSQLDDGNWVPSDLLSK